MFTDPSRTICGYATIFGVPNPNDRRIIYTAAMFRRFLDLEIAVPLRLDHGPVITSRGCIRYIGVVRQFRAVEYPVPGLLALGEIDAIPEVAELFADLQAITRQRWLEPAWGMSIGCDVVLEEGIARPFEVSVTRDRAFEDAKILAVGERAMSTWDLLTERGPVRSGDS
jgi:hypothetical protein